MCNYNKYTLHVYFIYFIDPFYEMWIFKVLLIMRVIMRLAVLTAEELSLFLRNFAEIFSCLT